MLYQVYLITNKVNNKKYVGQTNKRKSFTARFKAHISEALYPKAKHLSALHKAIRKYGPDNFDIILLEDNIAETDIDTREQYYIEKYNTHIKNNCGYNMTNGGQGVHGYVHTLATKQKISAANKKIWADLKELDPESYQQRCRERSDRLKGKPKSSETRAKLSLAAKKRFKDKHGTFYKKKHTLATKNKIGEANGCAVNMLDIKTGKILKTFQSATKATEYLIAQNKTTNKFANARIFEICAGHGISAYGYRWEKCN